MPIKTYRPTTQTLRYRTTLVNDDITTKHPYKLLLEPNGRILANLKRENARRTLPRETCRLVPAA